MYIISILFGIILVVIALYLIRREFKKSLNLKLSQLGDFSDVEKRELVEIIEGVKEEINSLNESFYEITKDLEGKYSLHEYKIKELDKKIQKNTKEFSATYEKDEDISEKKGVARTNDRYTEIKKMQQDGMTLAEIARVMNMGKREVEILISLYEN